MLELVTHDRSTSNPNMAGPLDADSEVGHILGRALDRTASLRTGVSQELLVACRPAATARKVVHEELALQWVVASGNSRQLAHANPWFFFELMFKSMVCTLASGGRLDSPRRLRFSERFCDDITTLVDNITKDVVATQARHAAEAAPDVSRLNAALAFFINDLLSVMDRSFVLGLVRLYCREMASQRTTTSGAQLIYLKLDFLRIVCSHEHYFSLNLPFCTPLSGALVAASPTPSVGSASSQSSYLSTLVANERPRFGELSVHFLQQHYLAGLVLQELRATLPPSGRTGGGGSGPGTQRRAVALVRSLLAWHDADPRFQEQCARARVALLYLPLVPIVLDSLDQMFGWGAAAHR
ncbi:Dedicator of cytokinesis protein 7 [Amphibalanus amphitrite]|uniref:Dedicator of cytokinesis protein 7 n=1 Tax=Amphibalanus amphitrite TaxID=1232801 RepID=A0A6A4UYC5_AMPAM|nr:Dedicator of cytokinesis protein 7 [Amphibalanus amphitrite]